MASSSFIGEDSLSSIHSLVIDESQPSQSYITQQAAEYAAQFVITSSTDTVPVYNSEAVNMRHDLLAPISQQQHQQQQNGLLDSNQFTEPQMPCGLEKLEALSYKELQQIAMKLQYPGNMKGSVLKQLLRARYDGNEAQVNAILERHNTRYRRDRHYSSEDRPRRRNRTANDDPQWLPPRKRTHGYLSDDSSVYFGIAQSPISYDSSEASQDQRSICTVELGSSGSVTPAIVDMPPPPPLGPPSMQSMPSQPAPHAMQSPQAGLMPPPYSLSGHWMASSHMSWANHSWMPPLQQLQNNSVSNEPESTDAKKKQRKPRKSKNSTSPSWHEEETERERQENSIRALQIEQQELMAKTWHKSQQEIIQSQQQLAAAQHRDMQQVSSLGMPPPCANMPPPPPPTIDQDSTAVAMKFYNHLNAATHSMSTHATQNHLQPLHPSCYHPQAFNSQFRGVGPQNGNPPRYLLPPSQYPLYCPPPALTGQYATSSTPPPPPPPAPSPAPQITSQLQQPPPSATPGSSLDHTRFPVLSSLLDRAKPNPPSCTVTRDSGEPYAPANVTYIPDRPKTSSQNCTVTRESGEPYTPANITYTPRTNTPTVVRETKELYFPANIAYLAKLDQIRRESELVDMRYVPVNSANWESFNRMHNRGPMSVWSPQEARTDRFMSNIPMNYTDQSKSYESWISNHYNWYSYAALPAVTPNHPIVTPVTAESKENNLEEGASPLTIQDLSSRNDEQSNAMNLAPTQTLQTTVEGVELVSEESADYDAAVAAHMEENLPTLNDNFLNIILSPNKKFLCPNLVNGCYQGFPDAMQCRVHEQYCLCRCVACFIEACRWTGLLGQLSKHLRLKHGPRLVSNEEAAHVVILSELRNKHKICFVQSAYERLFIIEVYFRGQVIHAACQWIPEPSFLEKDKEAPLGTIEVVSVVDTQCHTWKGYLPTYPTTFCVPRGMLTNSIYPCLSLPLPWAYHTHISHIVIHVGLHMMPKPGYMPALPAAASSPVRYHRTPSPQQQPQESQQQEEGSQEEEEEEEEHAEEEGENLVIPDDSSQSKES